MGERKFTLIELHVNGDTSLGLRGVANAVLGRGDEESAAETVAADSTDESDGAATGEESGGPGALGVLVGLVALVAVAALVRKFRGGADDDEPELDEFEEPDVVVN